MYRCLIHPGLPGLSFVGYHQNGGPGKFELQAEIGVRYFLGKLKVTEDELWQGVTLEESLRPLSGKTFPAYTFHAHIVECLRLLEMNLDLDFITNQLQFGDGPLIPQLFFLDRPGQLEIAKKVIDDIRSRHPNFSNFFR